MSLRLDEVLTPLFNEVQGDCWALADMVGADGDEMYDLLCSQWGESGSITINGYTFNYETSCKKSIDDYCEGKCNYHYDIQLKDKDSGNLYEVTTSFYNDEVTDFGITYKGNEKEIQAKKEQDAATKRAKQEEAVTNKILELYKTRGLPTNESELVAFVKTCLEQAK